MNATRFQSSALPRRQLLFVTAPTSAGKYFFSWSPALLALALATGLGQLATPARAQANPLDVGVRATVTDETAHSSNNKTMGDGGHGRVYGILKVDQIKSDRDLVRPVDEKYLSNVLLHELDANGFRQFVQGQRPEILLTVSYGRGELANPYMGDTGEVGGAGTGGSGASRARSDPGQDGGGGVQHDANGGFTSTDAPQQTITGMGAQLMDQKGNGFEAKLQKAGYEKLFIRVTAWDYPTKDAKPKMLWKTVMVVDDPDNRDLNAVAAKMLEAGAPYFDKAPKEREIDVYKQVLDGRVNVGTPEVVQSEKK